ncbi:MAG: hypothetical protein FWB81_03915 [Cystobacterineae bacterium]|nr:hypothetical protein [Cystobacterineae bacterium]
MMSRHRLVYMACICLVGVVGVGCPSPKGVCTEEKGWECPDGSYCMRGIEDGLCIWGKLGTNGKVVPDVRIRLTEGALSASKRTSSEVLTVHAEIYGAPRGVETWFEIPSGVQASACVQYSEELNGGLRRLKCTLRSGGEGVHKLTVHADGVEGSTVEAFLWTYDITPPRLRVHLEPGIVEKGRDGAFYMQLENADGDIDWGRSEFYIGEGQQHRAVRAACPEGFSAIPHAECLLVLLAELPNLPHGDYRLKLTAKLVDEAGNTPLPSPTEEFALLINRKLKNFASGLQAISTGVITREGLLVLLVNKQPGNFLIAINAEGETRWERELIDTGGGDRSVLLGNHQGTDVVVASCVDRDLRRGFYAVNASTGRGLFQGGCVSYQWSSPHWAMLQGGPGKDLVVVRRVSLAQQNTYTLEACRFVERASAWVLDCRASSSLPNPGTYNDCNELLVHQVEGRTRVLTDSTVNHWHEVEWREGEWTALLPGPSMSAGLAWGQTHFLGAQYRWVWYTTHGGVSELRSADFSNQWGDSVGARPLLMGSNDELIARGADDAFWRFSPLRTPLFPGGTLLFSGELGGASAIDQKNVALVEGEGGREQMILPSTGAGGIGISCLNTDFSRCWEGSSTTYANAQLLGILPKSAGRGVAVFSDAAGAIAGFLIDAPRLKGDVPWPIWRHDLCRSSNANVPIDNCWDGPRP